MARIETEVMDLAKRIQGLPDAERAKILARVMIAEGKKVPWSAVEAIQQRARDSKLDPKELERDTVEAVPRSTRGTTPQEPHVSRGDRKPRAVVDTSVFVAAVLSPDGPSAEVIKAARRQAFTIVTSAPILDEMVDVLARKKIQKKVPLSVQETLV